MIASDPSPADARLRSGRHGLPREFVVASQRDRLLDAMARVTAEKGYGATTVADVVARAQVSRATFYEQFRDKEECLLAALETIVEQFLRTTVLSEEAQRAPWDERVELVLDGILRFMAAEPHFARMAMVEVLGAGDAAWDRYRLAVDVIATQLDRGREDHPSARGLRPGTAAATVDGIALVVRDEILAGRTAALPGLAPDLLYSALVPYVGREEALRRRRAAGGGPPPPPATRMSEPPAPEPADAERRMMGALLASLAEKGYAKTTVADVARRAAVSRSTFYAAYASKEACFLRAHEHVLASLREVVAGAYDAPGPWPSRVDAALRALMAAFAAHPSRGRVLLRETFAVGPAAHERLRAGVRAFLPFLDEGRIEVPGGEQLPATTARVALGAIAGSVIVELAQGNSAELAAALDDLEEAALLQFLGPEGLPGGR